MTSTDEWLANRIAITVRKLGQRSAREKAKEMRDAAAERARLRKENLRMRIELGSLIVEAGLSAWTRAELLGLLIDGRDRATHSPTARLAMRKRGEAFFLSPATNQSAPVTSTTSALEPGVH